MERGTGVGLYHVAMEFDAPALVGRFRRRYKRFFAEVELPDGELVTAHCPNTGSLLGCLEEGAPAILRDSGNPKRKLRHTWQAIEIGGSWVNVDTALPNRIVHEGIESGRIAPLRGYETIRREVPYGQNSRIDLLLTGPDRPDCFVEVKSTTLLRGRTALFPDAVTERGRKHLGELSREARSGRRAVQLFLVSRDDATRFRPADDIDPAYAAALREAVEDGVEVLAYAARTELSRMEIVAKLRVDLGSRPRARSGSSG